MSDGVCATCDTAWCPWRSDMVRGCSHYTTKPETNYERLFGTPERAARTLHGGTLVCRECLIREQCAETPEDGNCMIADYDALLEWLRGDA